MYDELVKRLRERSVFLFPHHGESRSYDAGLMHEAADAIEELSKTKWIPFKTRPMDEDERKEWSEKLGYDIEYEDAVIYTGQLPDDGQEVLVCSKYGHVWIDTFDDDPDYGIGFETNGDMDGLVAWTPLPEPPKEE